MESLQKYSGCAENLSFSKCLGVRASARESRVGATRMAYSDDELLLLASNDPPGALAAVLGNRAFNDPLVRT